jgi:hypothetical protein
MSHGDVEIVREGHRAFNAHDLDRFVEVWDPSVSTGPGWRTLLKELEAFTAAARASAAGGRRCTRPPLK